MKKIINLKESLLSMDKDTDCRYDLTNLYEACNLDDKKKRDLAKYVTAYDIEGTNKFLSNEASSMGLMENATDDLSDEEFEAQVTEGFIHMTDENTCNPLVMGSSLKEGDLVYDEETGNKLKVVSIEPNSNWSRNIQFIDTTTNETFINIVGNNSLWETAVDGDATYEVDDDIDFEFHPIDELTSQLNSLDDEEPIDEGIISNVIGGALKGAGQGLLGEDLNTSSIEQEVKDVMYSILEPIYDTDFVNDYCSVSVEDTEDNVIVHVSAELGFNALLNLGNKLNKIVTKYDPKTYFETETSGRLVCYIRKDQSDDIVDEEAVEEWTTKFNACKTRDELISVYKELVDLCDNGGVTYGTIEVLFDVIDAKSDELEKLGESLTESKQRLLRMTPTLKREIINIINSTFGDIHETSEYWQDEYITPCDAKYRGTRKEYINTKDFIFEYADIGGRTSIKNQETLENKVIEKLNTLLQDYDVTIEGTMIISNPWERPEGQHRIQAIAIRTPLLDKPVTDDESLNENNKEIKFQVTADLTGMDDVYSEHTNLKDAIESAKIAQQSFMNVKIKDLRDNCSWQDTANAEADLNDGLVEESLNEDFSSITALADDCGKNTFKTSNRDIRFTFNDETSASKFMDELRDRNIHFDELPRGIIKVNKSVALDKSLTEDNNNKVVPGTLYKVCIEGKDEFLLTTEFDDIQNYINDQNIGDLKATIFTLSNFKFNTTPYLEYNGGTYTNLIYPDVSVKTVIYKNGKCLTNLDITEFETPSKSKIEDYVVRLNNDIQQVYNDSVIVSPVTELFKYGVKVDSVIHLFDTESDALDYVDEYPNTRTLVTLNEDSDQPEKYIKLDLQEPEYDHFTIGGKEVPYRSHEEAKAHLDDFNLKDYEEELYKYLKSKNMYPEMYVDNNNTLCVMIEWGDWKHDHMYIDSLINNFFFNRGLILNRDTVVTEDDGSDVYSATHYYTVQDVIFSMSMKNNNTLDESVEHNRKYVITEGVFDDIKNVAKSVGRTIKNTDLYKKDIAPVVKDIKNSVNTAIDNSETASKIKNAYTTVKNSDIAKTVKETDTYKNAKAAYEQGKQIRQDAKQIKQDTQQGNQSKPQGTQNNQQNTQSSAKTANSGAKQNVRVAVNSNKIMKKIRSAKSAEELDNLVSTIQQYQKDGRLDKNPRANNIYKNAKNKRKKALSNDGEILNMDESLNEDFDPEYLDKAKQDPEVRKFVKDTLDGKEPIEEDFYDDDFTDEEMAGILGGELMYCPDCGSGRYYDGHCYACDGDLNEGWVTSLSDATKDLSPMDKDGFYKVMDNITCDPATTPLDQLENEVSEIAARYTDGNASPEYEGEDFYDDEYSGSKIYNAILKLYGRDNELNESKSINEDNNDLADQISEDDTYVYNDKPVPERLEKQVKKVIIPDSATIICEMAFMDCTNLTSITIPDGITIIGSRAFQNCTSLTSISIPDSVTEIGWNAFSGCTSLTSISIPYSVTNISKSAFRNTGYYNEESNWENGVLYIGNHLVDAKEDISGNCVIREGTKTVFPSAFEDCTRLASVTIPGSVTSIGDRAFYYCEKLTSVTIPNSVTSIGTFTFRECTSLKSATIPDSVTEIEKYAFAGCDNLTINTTKGSYAEQYAKERGITVKYIDRVNESVYGRDNELNESKSINEVLNDYRFEVSCNDGPSKVITTVATNEESAINYVKKYYAQEHTTYADDRVNKWVIRNLD